jgi:hypothetical protein
VLHCLTYLLFLPYTVAAAAAVRQRDNNFETRYDGAHRNCHLPRCMKAAPRSASSIDYYFNSHDDFSKNLHVFRQQSLGSLEDIGYKHLLHI